MASGHWAAPSRTAIAVTLCCALLLLGCSGRQREGLATAPPVVAVRVDPDLAARVPGTLRERGRLAVATDPSYRPMEYFDSSGLLTGLEIQLVLAIAATLGLEPSFSNEAFTALAEQVAAGRFAIGAGALTLQPGDSFPADAVLYLGTGVQLARRAGSRITLDSLCGAKIAALEGSTQLSALAQRSRSCTAAGRSRITIITRLTQADVTRAVLTGTAEGMVADSPVIQAEGKSHPGELQAVDGLWDPTSFALLTGSEGDSGLAGLVADTIDHLIEQGAYERILLAFGVTQGGVDGSVVLPAGQTAGAPADPGGD